MLDNKQPTLSEVFPRWNGISLPEDIKNIRLSDFSLDMTNKSWADEIKKPEVSLAIIQSLKRNTSAQIQYLNFYRRCIHREPELPYSKEQFEELSKERQILYVLSTPDINKLAQLTEGDCVYQIKTVNGIDSELIANANYTLWAAANLAPLQESKNQIMKFDFRHKEDLLYSKIYTESNTNFVLNLQGANLLEAHMLDYDLRGINFQNAFLAGATLPKSVHDADFGNANLTAVYWYQADLRNSKLQGAKLSQAKLYQANMQFLNLPNVNLKEAQLKKADLQDIILHGANLLKADLSEAKLQRANLQQAGLSDANLRKTDLRNTDFRGANLDGADFGHANAEGAKFKDCSVVLTRNLDVIFRAIKTQSVKSTLRFFNQKHLASAKALKDILEQYNKNSDVIFGKASNTEKSEIRQSIANSLVKEITATENVDKKTLLEAASKHSFFKRLDHAPFFKSNSQAIFTNAIQSLSSGNPLPRQSHRG